MFFEFTKHFLHLSFELILLFVVISFFVAFIQKQFPQDKIKNILIGGHNYASAIKGASIGFLTPFCSCSAIPLLIALLQANAPFCGAMSYLFAAPLLNPIVIVLFINFFGIAPTIFYAITMFAFAVILGIVIHKLGYEDQIKNLQCTQNCKCTEKEGIRHKAKTALEDCFDVFQKILPHLLLGAFIATLVHDFIPREFIEKALNQNEIYSTPLASLIGLPLHVHPSTMLPIADVLIKKGVSLGTIIALIIASAGVSLPEITLLNGIFKRKIIIIFILCVFLVAIISGSIFNLIFA